MLKELRQRFRRTNQSAPGTEARDHTQTAGTTNTQAAELKPLSPREQLVRSLGADFRNKASYAATGGLIGTRSTDIKNLLAEAERRESTASKTIDLFEQASGDPKVASFRETTKSRLLDLGYDDVVDELNYLEKLSPLEQYAESIRREPISPFSYLVNMVNTFSLALVDDGKIERTIPLSSPTLNAEFDGSDTLAMRRATRNVYTILGLDVNELRDIAPQIKSIKPGEEIPQTHFLNESGLVVTLTFHGASQRRTSSYVRNIPHLTLTIS
jgi:hypothetical protein